MPIARFLTPFFYLKRPITKKDYILALIVSSIVSFLILIKNFYLIFIAFFIIGVSFAIIFPFIETIAVEKLKEKYGKVRVFGSIGFMLFGIIASYVEFNLVYSFIVLMLITNFIAIFFITDKSIKRNLSSIDFKKEWKFWIALILMQISFGGFYNFFTIYNIQSGIDKAYIGWLWAIGVIAEIIVFIIGDKFLNKLSLLEWIKISILLTSIRWFMLYFFKGNLILIAFSQLIHAFSFAIFHMTALLYLSKVYENKTLAQQFYAGISYGLAGFIGSFISGFLYGDKLYLYESLIAFGGFVVLNF